MNKILSSSEYQTEYQVLVIFTEFGKFQFTELFSK